MVHSIALGRQGIHRLCWSEDGVHIFSASYDGTIQKWRSINGKELVVSQGYVDAVNSLRLSPDESHLFGAALTTQFASGTS